MAKPTQTAPETRPALAETAPENFEIDLSALVDELRRIVDAPMTCRRREEIQDELLPALCRLKGDRWVKVTTSYYAVPVMRVDKDGVPRCFVGTPDPETGEQPHYTSEAAAIAGMTAQLEATPKATWAEVWRYDLNRKKNGRTVVAQLARTEVVGTP